MESAFVKHKKIAAALCRMVCAKRGGVPQDAAAFHILYFFFSCF